MGGRLTGPSSTQPPPGELPHTNHSPEPAGRLPPGGPLPGTTGTQPVSTYPATSHIQDPPAPHLRQPPGAAIWLPSPAQASPTGRPCHGATRSTQHHRQPGPAGSEQLPTGGLLAAARSPSPSPKIGFLSGGGSAQARGGALAAARPAAWPQGAAALGSEKIRPLRVCPAGALSGTSTPSRSASHCGVFCLPFSVRPGMYRRPPQSPTPSSACL